MTQLNILQSHLSDMMACTLCKDMPGSVVVGPPVLSKVMLLGQAPGPREANFGKPFAWTAGKTLFTWFQRIGIGEEDFRKFVFISAVCRCFPGKAPGGGDRVPSKTEIQNCSRWVSREIEILRPELIIPVGRLAIEQFLSFEKLNDIIGQKFPDPLRSGTEIIPLPHPSGVSSWFKTQPGIGLLENALNLIANHTAFKNFTQTHPN